MVAVEEDAEAVVEIKTEVVSSVLPQNITFQWHITDICNLRCKHCYQESYNSEGLPIDELLPILDRLEMFALTCKKQNGKVKAHINITGGEPFLKRDILQLLEQIRQKQIFSFSILSNGYLLAETELKQLKNLKPTFVQISLEGSKRINDSIRGEGSFEKIVSAMEVYKKLKIPVMVSFTSNSLNYMEFNNVVKISKKYGAFKVWTDRYLPALPNDPLLMTTDQSRDLIDTIKKEQTKNKSFLSSRTKVSSERALQFLTCGGKPYSCSAGKSLLSIASNGDLMPCRRLPIIIGNLVNDNILNLYTNNEELKKIRNHDLLNEDCKKCFYKYSCNGGLKCLSYACFNDYTRKDPNCWI